MNVIAATQKALDALPLDSGKFRIEGVAGLYVRSRATSKSFLLRRRVQGRLIEAVLGPLEMKQAVKQARAEYDAMKPATHGKLTLSDAIKTYVEGKLTRQRPLSDTTKRLHLYNLKKYLSALAHKPLASIDPQDVLNLRRKLTPATANQVVRLLSSCWRWQRRTNPKLRLPECPINLVDHLQEVKERDWAYADSQLRAWWRSIEGKNDKQLVRGVSTLGPIKQAFWCTLLYTGARRGSVEALRWADVDLDRKVLKFSTAKAHRTYTVPIADRLAALLKTYRDSGAVPPSPWCFPSSKIPDGHLTHSRDDKRGVKGAHHLRHTFNTALGKLHASKGDKRLLMGHASSDVNDNYDTDEHLIESLRPLVNAVATKYAEVLKWQ
jgi:integrase